VFAIIALTAAGLADGCGSDVMKPLGSLSLDEGCYPVMEGEPSPPGCLNPPPDTDPNPGSPGIFVYYWDGYSCYGGWDPDQDGLHNGCENALAEAFTPSLVVFPGDCGWDNSLSREGGEYMFAAQPVAGVVRLVFMPAYYRDCGSSGTPINSWFTGAGAHTGDSEFMMIDVTFDPSTYHWVADSVFLSAHCDEHDVFGNRLDTECHWFDPSVFAWRDGHALGAPVIWVAQMKHANYNSQGACDSNNTILHLDDCDHNTVGYIFPVAYEQQNAGSANYPLPESCPHAFTASPMTSPSARECFWNPLPEGRFNGWQSGVVGGGSQGYGNHLRIHAAFF
jgi:hypothetical protein